MNAREFDTAFDFLLTTSANPAELKSLLHAVQQELGSESSIGNALAALDRSVSREDGGYAFLWKDVLDIGDLCEVLLGGLSGSLLPDQLGKVVVTVLRAWHMMRHVRVHIDEDEFRVLRAVKRGGHGIDQVAATTGLSRETVEKIVSGLRQRTYREEFCLIDVDPSGALTTRF